MRTALIFVSSAIFGIALLFFGTWIWFDLAEWLPYKRPNPAIVAQIEKLVANRPDDWTKTIPRPENYRRWYVEGNDDGRRVIWGQWDLPREGIAAGLHLGHRRFPPGWIGMLGGGCSQVHILYDLATSRLREFACNAPM